MIYNFPMATFQNELTAKKRMAELTKTIRYHNQKYHQDDAPEIDDYEFDVLFEELKSLEAKYPQFVDPKSPTQDVGAQVNEIFTKVEHPFPMYSLDKAMNEEELEDWVTRREKDLGKNIDAFSCSLKLDGLAIELIYRKGKLVQGSTRGDGETGEDVTHNLLGVASIPHEISEKNEVVVRGEIVMTNEGFLKLNDLQEKNGDKIFANPRNAAAGSIRQKDASVTKSRPLVFFAYQLANFETLSGHGVHGLESQHEHFLYLKRLGFTVNAESEKVASLAELKNYFQKILSLRDQLPFEVDGIVIKIDSTVGQNFLGVVGRRPRYGLAVKFPPVIAGTILKDVLFQVGRTGAVTPVGILEPVRLSGAVVSRVTLHNESEIERKDMRIGDFVMVVRSGEVIPKILSVDLTKRKANAKKIKFPEVCPSCGSALTRDLSGDGVIIRCESQTCPAKNLHKLMHFVSKSAMNIEGLGEEWIREMVEKGLVKTSADFYRIQGTDLDGFERMGEKLKSNFLAAIEGSKQVSFDRFIYALGIRGVGEKTAKNLAKLFKTVDTLLKVGEAELLELNDFGEVSAKQITDFFSEPDNRKLVADLIALGVSPKPVQVISSGGAFSGKKILFTGTLSMPRRLAKEKAEALGAELVSSISSSTDFLVCGEDAGSKLKKAKELGVKVLSEQEFLDMIG